MFNKILIFLILLLSIICLSTVSAADNITGDDVVVEKANIESISVEKMENDDVLKEGGNSFGDLANLINNAPSGSTITLDRDYVNNDDYSYKGIKITKDITIDGQGHTLDANRSSRMFEVEDGHNVVFGNISFINGDSNGNEEVLHMNDGGAINGKCTAINCYFYYNHAVNNGGAMAYGTAINCTFEDNGVSNGAGSATYNVDAKFCTFKGQQTMKGGSKFLCIIYRDNIDDTEEIIPSFTMTGDTTTQLGGKVYFEMEYDGQKYDGYKIYIRTTKSDGDIETLESSTGSEWTIPFVESREFKIYVDGYPEIPDITGKFDVYSDVFISGNNFMTWYSYDDSIEIQLVDNLKRPMKNIDVSYKMNNNTTNVKTNDNGQISIPIDGLNPDTYKIEISYAGTDHYTGITKTITLTIIKGITRLIPINIVTTYNITQYLEITLTDNKGNILENATVSVELNGTEEYTTDSHGKIKISTEGLAPGTYEYNVTFHENVFYQESTTTAKAVVNKLNTRLTASPVLTFYNIEDYLLIYLFDAFGNPVSDAVVSVELNGTKNYTSDKNGRIKVHTKGIVPNVYDTKIIFRGTEIYHESNTTVEVVVSKANPKLILTSLSTDYNSGEKFIIKLIDNLGNPIAGETVQFALSGSENTTDENGMIIFSTNVGQGWEIRLIDNQGNPINGASVSANLSGVKNFTTDEEGQIKIFIKNVLPYTYFANVIFNGNELYSRSNANTKLIVNKLSTTLTTNSITTVFNSDENLIVTLKNSQGQAISGVQVSVDLNGIKNYTTDMDGQIKISTGNIPPGNYIVKIKFDENYYYKGSSAETAVIIKKSNTKLDVDYMNDGSGLIITLMDNQSKPISKMPVSVDLGGVKNYTTNFEGQIFISAHDLILDSYAAKIEFGGNENYTGSKLETTLIIKKATKLTADNLIVNYNANQEFIITLKDSADKAVVNAFVSVDLNGINNYTTDKNGQIKIPIFNFTPNTYAVKINFDGNDFYIGSELETVLIVKKATTKLTAGAVTAAYNDNKYLVITLKDGADKPIIGASLSVDFKGVKTYTTDKNGQVKISVQNLAPNTYVAKISYAGNETQNRFDSYRMIVVKKATPKLKVKAKSFKVKTKTKKYSVILKSNKNKAMKNVKVYLKVKGKTYAAKTNSKGKATFKITKLTKKGKHTAVVAYKGNAYYNKVAKKVKIKIR